MTHRTSNNKSPRRSQKKYGKRPFFILLLLAAIVAVTALLFVSVQKEVPPSLSELKTTVTEKVETGLTKLQKITQKKPQEQIAPKAEQQPTAQNSQLLQENEELKSAQQKEELKDSEEIAEEIPAEKVLETFYQDLDKREYMQRFSLQQPSQEHFSRLIQKLLDNPPVVVRETDDLYILLKNTAHFFRILGKSNVLMLKGILDREKDSLEDILKSLYLLTEEPERLQREFGIKLDDTALYDYAGFFLNTMGGRLYLFRRDSSSRMVVTYYAIRILDRANNSQNSPHGIDIRPAINALIDEMENGGNNLDYRNLYLEELYALQKKYQR